MVNVVRKNCSHEGCPKRLSFGLEPKIRTVQKWQYIWDFYLKLAKEGTICKVYVVENKKSAPRIRSSYKLSSLAHVKFLVISQGSEDSEGQGGDSSRDLGTPRKCKSKPAGSS